MRDIIYGEFEMGVLLSEQIEDCRGARQRRRDVPSGFRYAKHSDEPLKREPVGYQPSCFPGLTTTSALCLLNLYINSAAPWTGSVPGHAGM